MTGLTEETLAQLDARVSRPRYDRRHVTTGIVHIGQRVIVEPDLPCWTCKMRPLAQVAEAFELASSGDHVKVLVTIGER